MMQHAIHIYIFCKCPNFSPLNLEVSHALYHLIFPQLYVNQFGVMRQNNIYTPSCSYFWKDTCTGVLLCRVNKSFILLYRGRKANSIVKTFFLESISNSVYNHNNFIDHFHVSCLQYFPAAILFGVPWIRKFLQNILMNIQTTIK